MCTVFARIVLWVLQALCLGEYLQEINKQKLTLDWIGKKQSGDLITTQLHISGRTGNLF